MQLSVSNVEMKLIVTFIMVGIDDINFHTESLQVYQ